MYPLNAHGINTARGPEQQMLAVQTGDWPILRYDPRRTEHGAAALQLDCEAPSLSVERTMYSEPRFRMLAQSNPQVARTLRTLAQDDVDRRCGVRSEVPTLPTPPPAEAALIVAQHDGRSTGGHDHFGDPRARRCPLHRHPGGRGQADGGAGVPAHEQMPDSKSQLNVANPAAFERDDSMKALDSFTPQVW